MKNYLINHNLECLKEYNYTKLLILPDVVEQNLVILSKFSIKDAQYLKLTDSKQCLCTDIEINPCFNIVITNVHLPADKRNSTDTNNHKLRQDIIVDVSNWMNAKFDHTNMVILGDFNDKDDDIKLNCYQCSVDEQNQS